MKDIGGQNQTAQYATWIMTIIQHILHIANLTNLYSSLYLQKFVTHKILFRYVSRPVQWIDEKIINGLIDFTAWGANEAGETIRPWQSGDVRQYAVWFITGTVALTLLLLCL